MRAQVTTAFGRPEVIQPRDVPEPELREHDLLLDVHAVAMNATDLKFREGVALGCPPPPFIQGYDVSGVVRGMGPAVRGFAVGDEVYASPNRMRHGANAERVAVDARTAAHKPRTLSHVEAAALPLCGLTAWEALYDRVRLAPGEAVLIQAGGGGVGHLAIQLAVLRGARVLTTASQPETSALCVALGADVVIDHREEDVVARVLAETGGQGCPVVFDTIGRSALASSVDSLAINGRLVTIVPTPLGDLTARLFAQNATVHWELVSTPTYHDLNLESQGRILAALAELVDEGLLRPHVSAVLTLDEVVEAHRRQETGHTVGKLVLTGWV